MQLNEAKILAARLKKISRIVVVGVKSSGLEDGDKILHLRLGRRELKVSRVSDIDTVVGKVARLAGTKSGAWIQLGVCPVCLHTLKAFDGHFHETKVEYGRTAYAEPLCCKCLTAGGGNCSLKKEHLRRV